MYPLPRVDVFTAVKNGFTNYVNFKGRLRRSEFWLFFLSVNFVTLFFLTLFLFYITGVITITKTDPYYYDQYYYNDYEKRYHDNYYNYHYSYTYEGLDYTAILTLGILLGIHILFVILPVLSAVVRRLHDIGQPGELIFIALVPFFGGIALLVLLCTDSVRETNEYGPPPKYTSMNDINLNLNMNNLAALTQPLTAPKMSTGINNPIPQVNQEIKLSPLDNPQSDKKIYQMNDV